MNIKNTAQRAALKRLTASAVKAKALDPEIAKELTTGPLTDLDIARAISNTAFNQALGDANQQAAAVGFRAALGVVVGPKRFRRIAADVADQFNQG